ncbi:MAG: hypothetical protein Q4A72_05505 [Bacillota bacterium]|nr:hypothetical protein [Bacillota bacterium]
MSVKGSIGIKDNVTAVLQSVKKEQARFRKDVEETRKAMQQAYDKKRELRINASPAMKSIKKVTERLAPFRKKLVKAVAIKDLTKSKLSAIRAKMKAVGAMSVKPVVSLKNKAAAGISKVKGMLSSLLKSVAIPVTLAIAGGAVGVSKALSAGMELEQQQISMEHFIGATNKDLGIAEVKKVAENFTKELRENANATPFETGEVIQAGSRAIAIANGNTAEAMGLVKLAEDMAAASGGTKDISQAIEALADAKMGEMERLKEFGFKVSADEFGQKGFEGIAEDLGAFYGGASEKLAKSGAGILSTIKGKLKSSFADFGLNLVNKLKPTFEKVVDLIDKTAPFFEEFGEKMASGIERGVNLVVDFIPVLKGVFDSFKPVAMKLHQAIVPVVQSIMNTLKVVIPSVIPVIQSVVSTVTDIFQKASPIISAIVEVIGTTISTLAPVFQTIFDSIGSKVGEVIGFISERMGFIQEIFEFVMPVVSDVLSTAWSIMEPILSTMITVFKAVWEVIEFVFPAIKSVISTVWGVLKPIFDAIADALTWVGEAVESIIGWFGDVFHGVFDSPAEGALKSSSPGENARGTDNWRGGLTWVGEEGPELMEVPKGSRILPNKASTRLMSNNPLPVPNHTVNQTSVDKRTNINITIPKLSDSIVVREEADIDRIGESIVKRLSISKLITA